MYVHVCVSLKRIYEVASNGVFREFVNGIKHASASFIRCLSCLSFWNNKTGTYTVIINCLSPQSKPQYELKCFSFNTLKAKFSKLHHPNSFYSSTLLRYAN